MSDLKIKLFSILNSIGPSMSAQQSEDISDAFKELDRLRAEVASIKEELAATQSVGLRYARENHDLTQQLAAAKGNNQQLRGALELAQLTLANYFEATRRMPECNAIDQNVGQVIKDVLAATPDKFNPDWSLLEATQESLREHMVLLAAANEQAAKWQGLNAALETMIDVKEKRHMRELAAANGRVEKMREALELAHGHLLVWQTPQYQPKQNVFDTVTAALSDLPQQVKSEDARDAARYRYLRNRDIENDFPRDGLFIGCIPDNAVLSMDDADAAIDAAIAVRNPA